MKPILILLLVAAAIEYGEGHGHMFSPLARTSQFLNDPVNRPPYYYNNKGVWCNNVKQDMEFSQCGRCGGPFGNDADFNRGGAYDKGDINGNYTAGSIIDVVAEISAPHRGFFEVDLCPQAAETDSCFYRLPIVGGSEQIRIDNRICVPYNDERDVTITAKVQLPSGVRCSLCTLRWTYRTSYKPEPDFCFNPNPAQTFRNCANISIR